MMDHGSMVDVRLIIDGWTLDGWMVNVVDELMSGIYPFYKGMRALLYFKPNLARTIVIRWSRVK